MPRVLIIEDNAKVADIVLQHLRKKGYDADSAPDGPSGLRSFAAGTYDLLLVDIRLPQLSGDEVCRKVRTSGRGKTIPIILMSGFVKDPSEIAALRQELGINAFLTKPFTSDALLAAVAAVLRTAAPSQAAPPPQVAGGAPLPQNIQGDLSRTPFEKVLLYLLKNRGTGTLTVNREAAVRRFFFVGGSPIEAELSSGDDDFGTYLSRRNLVSSAELAAYRMHRTRQEEDPRDLFVKMGCLTPERFSEENRSYLNDRLVDCFAWRTGTVVFTWRQAFIRDLPEAAVFLPGIFYRGFRSHLPPAVLGAFLGEKGNLYISKTPAFYDYQNHLANLVPSTELFDLINGLSTCSGISSVLDSEDTAVLLYTLDYLQAVSYSPTPQRSSLTPAFPLRKAAPKQREQPEEVETFEDLGGELSELAGEIGTLVEQQAPAVTAPEAPQDLAALEEDLRRRWEAVRDKNYYEIFGMTQNTFSFEELKNAYFRLTRTYGPEKFFASSGEVMELAEELLSRVSNAYSTLSNVVSKENYDALLVSQAPTGTEEKKFYEQVQFQSGKVMLEQGQYESAEKAFTTCLTLNPDKAEYQVYLAVAVYHNPANRGNTAAIKRAKDLVNKSLLGEKTSIAYALKGTMLLDEGLTNLAEAELAKALKLNPNNRTAQKKLEQIRQKKEEEEKKGFFQKMFK